MRGGGTTNTNHAVTDNLIVKKDTSGGGGNDRRSYLKFDFSGYTGSVTTAKLRLYVNGVDSDASRTLKIYGTTDESWSENTITYGNAPAGSTLITTLTLANTDGGKWFEADVSSYASADADKKVSFFIVNEGTSSSHNTVDFASKDSTVNKPILVIN